MIEDVFIFIGDLLDELIIDRAFNNNKKLSKRLPFIIIYYLIVLSVLALSLFIGINYILVHNVIGYFFLIISLLNIILFFLPFFIKKKINYLIQ